MSAIQEIVGQKITDVTDGLATYVPLDPSTPFPDGGSVAITRVLSIGPFTLEVVNPSRLSDRDGQDVSYQELIGRMIESIDEYGHTLRINLSGDLTLSIDLMEESYVGPEAMALYGPDDLYVVWN